MKCFALILLWNVLVCRGLELCDDSHQCSNATDQCIQGSILVEHPDSSAPGSTMQRELAEQICEDSSVCTALGASTECQLASTTLDVSFPIRCDPMWRETGTLSIDLTIDCCDSSTAANSQCTFADSLVTEENDGDVICPLNDGLSTAVGQLAECILAQDVIDDLQCEGECTDSISNHFNGDFQECACNAMWDYFGKDYYSQFVALYDVIVEEMDGVEINGVNVLGCYNETISCDRYIPDCEINTFFSYGDDCHDDEPPTTGLTSIVMELAMETCDLSRWLPRDFIWAVAKHGFLAAARYFCQSSIADELEILVGYYHPEQLDDGSSDGDCTLAWDFALNLTAYHEDFEEMEALYLCLSQQDEDSLATYLDNMFLSISISGVNDTDTDGDTDTDTDTDTDSDPNETGQSASGTFSDPDASDSDTDNSNSNSNSDSDSDSDSGSDEDEDEDEVDTSFGSVLVTRLHFTMYYPDGTVYEEEEEEDDGGNNQSGSTRSEYGLLAVVVLGGIAAWFN